MRAGLAERGAEKQPAVWKCVHRCRRRAPLLLALPLNSSKRRVRGVVQNIWSTPFCCKWECWGPETGSSSLKATWLISSRVETRTNVVIFPPLHWFRRTGSLGFLKFPSGVKLQQHQTSLCIPHPSFLASCGYSVFKSQKDPFPFAADSTQSPFGRFSSHPQLSGS